MNPLINRTHLPSISPGFYDHFSTVYLDGEFDADVWTSLVTSNLERHLGADDMVSTFEFESDDSVQLLSTPELPINLPTLPDLPSLPSFPEIPDLPTLLDLPLPPSVPDAIASFCLPSVPEGDPLSPERDSLSPEGASEVLSLSPEEIKPNLLDLSATNILPSPTEPNRRRPSRVSNAPLRLIVSCNHQSTLDIFHSNPTPTGPKQHSYKGGDHPACVSYESINQQYLAELGWAKLLNICSVTVGTIGAFMIDHSQNLSYGKLVEYLNLALYATMANKEDNPTYAEALYGPDSCGFIGAMETEILTLIELDIFELVKHELNMNVILGVWALCRNNIRMD